MSVVVAMPSRERPQRAAEAIHAARSLAVLTSTSIVLVVDADDSTLPAYRELTWDWGPMVHLAVLEPEDTGNLVRATNTIVRFIMDDEPDAIVGNLGDDHMVRTQGWDRMVSDALESPGIAYGDDKVHGEHLPTAPFISGRIIRALGYYALPDCAHMYIDNAWRDIAELAGVRRYLPDLVIEHMHPAVGKALWDDSYLRTNSDSAILRDRAHYESWRKHAMDVDVGRVRDALADL